MEVDWFHRLVFLLRNLNFACHWLLWLWFWIYSGVQKLVNYRLLVVILAVRFIVLFLLVFYKLVDLFLPLINLIILLIVNFFRFLQFLWRILTALSAFFLVIFLNIRLYFKRLLCLILRCKYILWTVLTATFIVFILFWNSYYLIFLSFLNFW